MSQLMADEEDADDEFWGQEALAEVGVRNRKETPQQPRRGALCIGLRCDGVHANHVLIVCLHQLVLQEAVDDEYKSEVDEEDQFDSDFNDSEVRGISRRIWHNRDSS